MPPSDHLAGPCVLALDIGGTHVSAAVVDAGNAVHDARRTPLDAGAPAAVILDVIAACAAPLAPRAGRIALAVPGPFDYRHGIGDFHGVAKFAQLRGVDMAEELAGRWAVGTSALRFVNDAEAFGLGEWSEGSGARADRCVTLTLGTGVGSAFIDRGRCVTDGPTVPADGNLHTVRIDGVPLEDRISRRALINTYRARTGIGADVAKIARRARAGDRAATETLADGMRALGTALAPWLIAFDAQRVVIGGSMAASEDLLLPPLRAQLAREMPTAPLVTRGDLPAERAALIGAVLGTRHPAP